METKAMKGPSNSVDIEGTFTSCDVIYIDIVEGQTELICRFNPQRNLVFVNDSYCRYFRKNRQELIGQSFMAFVHEKDRKQYAELLSSLDQANPVEMVEHRVILPGENIRWQQSTIRAIFDDRGHLAEYQAVGRDLTDRITAERALRESEKRYRKLIDRMFNGFALFEIIRDRNGKPVDCKFMQVNPAFEQITGQGSEEVLGKTLREVFPEFKQSWVDTCAQVAFNGEPFQFKKGFKKFGRELEILAYSPTQGQFATVFTDVTDRINMEKTLKERENNFRSLADNSNDGIRIATRKGEFVYANKRFSEITGYSLAELEKKNITDLDSPGVAHELEERHINLLEGKFSPTRYGSTIVHKNGKKIPVDVTASKTQWQGQPAAMVTIRDITLRRHMEEAIRNSANNFRNLANNANDGIIIAAEDGSIVYVNYRLAEMTGFRINKLRRSGIEAICHPDEVKKISKRHRLWLDGKTVPPRYQTILLKKEGLSLPVEVTASKTTWLGQPAVLWIIRDITLRKRIEEALGKVHNELERRVEERTKELVMTAEKLERKQNELLRHRLDLEKANKELVQTNTALSVLARNIDKKRDEAEKKIAQNISSQIIPLVKEIQTDKIPESSRAKLEVLTAYLMDLTPDSAKGHDIIVSLSSMELRVAVMIKNGFSSDDIARLLYISPHTVKTHRRNIRKKLRIKNSQVNLASYLRLKLGKMSNPSLDLH